MCCVGGRARQRLGARTREPAGLDAPLRGPRLARPQSFTPDQFADIMSVDAGLWKKELLSHEELFVELYDRLPTELQSCH